MKNTLKRLLSLVLVLLMVGSMLPTAYAQETAAQEDDVTVFTDEDYAALDELFAQIGEMEDAPEKKNASQTQLTDAAAEIVLASDNYVEDSLERNGDSFTWWTYEGIRCVYSPRMREIQDNMVAPEEPLADGVYNEPVVTKGGWPASSEVYLVGPYYGHDTSFTDQYKNEAKSIAAAIGDTDGYTLYSGTAATVDKVADAVSNGAVVIFDSHGNTDYENGYDCVTGANYSYLCLTSTTGLTSEDYSDGALYYSDGIWINGATIANHMTKKSPAGILWMAICLGMATDTFAVPMREMGVEVVYGYSESVTFDGDYLWEEIFWDNMCAGSNVATAIADMKSKCGEWDYCTKMYNYAGWSSDKYGPITSISSARSGYYAFPVVVSDEDAHPGQRSGNSNYGADSLQTVKSTYTLFSQYEVTAQSNNTAYGTVSVSGNMITATPAAGYFAENATVLSGTATVTQNGNTFSVMAESDCTVQINFAPKTAVTVNFSGANVAGQTGYAGDSMALPTAEAPEGYKFLGWMTASLSSDTTEKPTYYTDSFIPTGNTTLYALYSYMDENSGSGSGDYVKVTSAPADWSGEYVIVYETDGYIFDGSLASFDAASNYQEVTIVNNTIAAEEADAYKFTISAVDGGYSIQGVSGGYIGHGSNANGLTTGSSALVNTISLDASGNANIVGSGGAYLRFNATSGQTRFRYYKSYSYSSQKAIALYVKDGSAGTTYYTTTLCEHSSTFPVDAVEPSCTEIGYTAGTQCHDCGNYVTGHEIVDALGHSWGAWTETVAPQCETVGEETRICGTCGETETQAIAATGHNLGEGTVTTAATCTADGEMSYACGTCGNTTTEVIPATGHSYADGVCSVCGEEEPEASNRFYIAAIRSSGSYFYMTSDLGTSSTSRYQAVDSGLTVLPESITEPESGYVFVLIDNGDGTYSLQAEGVDGDNYLGWTSSNSGTLVAESSAVKATVDITDGIYNIHFAASDAERYLALNGTSGYNYFAWYKSGQKQDLVLIPVMGGGAAEPEVTEPEATEPEETEPEATEPEATEPEATEPEGSEPTADAYIKTDISSIAAGQKVVITMTNANGTYAMTNNNGSSKAPATVAVTVDGDKIISDVAQNILWNIDYNDGSFVIYPDGSTSTWLYCTNTNNGVRVGTNTAKDFVIDSTSGYMVHSYTGRYIGIYNSQDWRCYTSINNNIQNQTLTFYALGGGTAVPEPSEPDVTEPEVTEPEATEPEGDTLSIAEAVALGESMEHNTYTTNKYKVTGVITEVYNTQYGNMYITDESGKTLTVYGTYDATGEIRYDAMEVKPVAGDTVTIYGVVGQYNGAAQIKNGWLVEHIPAETEPEVTEPEVTEPEATEPEGSEPAGSVTELQYVFSKYTAGTQYAEGENHTLDDVIDLTINGAHLNSQIRLYAGSNAVFTSAKEIASIIVKAGYKKDTLNVYSSSDGATWEMIATQATTTTYTNYSFDMPAGCKYIKLESVGAQIRVSEMTISVIEPSVEPEVPALVAGRDMVLGSDLKINFYLNVKTNVSITLDGIETVIAADELTETEDGKYIATVSVAAAQMTDEITVREVGSENAQVYTVRQYADEILADSAHESYHVLVKEMLNYGGAAQKYFGHNESVLANNGITGVGTSSVPAVAEKDVTYDGAAEGITFYGASLVYRDKVALRFYFQTEGDITAYTFRSGDDTYEPVLTDKGYMIEVSAITPDKLDQQVTVTVTDAQSNVLSVSYGPMNYIVRMNVKGTESLQALMKALYNYHLAAKALTAEAA